MARRALRDVLVQIEEGMDVYDSEGDKVGTVKQVFLGTVGDEAEEAGYTLPHVSAPSTELFQTEPVVDQMIDGLVGADAVPEEVRERLLSHGFIEVDRGLLKEDAFILAERVVSVLDDGVRLGVRGEEL
ncbi:MAG: hypothetical protein M3220_22170 [Chloroflexota bacterium]|nr:hypothetical protein [Chloroflexota bacterium]